MGKMQNLVGLDGQGKPQRQGFIAKLHSLPSCMVSQRLLARIQVPETCPMAQNVIYFFQGWEETQSCKSLLRADAGIYGVHPGDSHNYECLLSSGH